MPRSSGRSSGNPSRNSSRSSSTVSRVAPPPAKTTPPPPATVPPPASAPAVHSQPQGGGGIMAGIMQGMTLGAGSAIGRRAVDSVFGAFGGSSETSDVPAAPTQPAATAPKVISGFCDVDQSALMRCLQENKSNASACDLYFNALQQCQKNNA